MPQLTVESCVETCAAHDQNFTVAAVEFGVNFFILSPLPSTLIIFISIRSNAVRPLLSVVELH